MTNQFDNNRMNPDRRQLLGAVAMSAVAAGISGLLSSQPASAAADTTIRPFRVNIPEHDLIDLRRRLAATKPRRLSRSLPDSGSGVIDRNDAHSRRSNIEYAEYSPE